MRENGERHPPPEARRWTGVAVLALAVLMLAACQRPSAPVELEWRERQQVFRLLAEPPRLEAYGLRGGVIPLGSVRLPAGACPRAMALDAEAGRVQVWYADGGVEIDARALRIVGTLAGDGVASAGNRREGAAVLARMEPEGCIPGATWAHR
ncbi:hypothetical protein dqs_0915 [Azoarcus olearius]|uniref:hypothetical protein n=1 Tax=Azoarcus sp. (strain BH72) TaxID=418699 RepID=UPI0008064335|nr:hypothetical protein [Azoarcus olearius]ANQ83983.1 hypothetical protein dqs_0915 [Azoarcus olearius]